MLDDAILDERKREMTKFFSEKTNIFIFNDYIYGVSINLHNGPFPYFIIYSLCYMTILMPEHYSESLLAQIYLIQCL